MMYCLSDLGALKSSSKPSPLCPSAQRQAGPPTQFQRCCKGSSEESSQFLLVMEGGAGQRGLLGSARPRAPRGQLAEQESKARSAAGGACLHCCPPRWLPRGVRGAAPCTGPWGM